MSSTCWEVSGCSLALDFFEYRDDTDSGLLLGDDKGDNFMADEDDRLFGCESGSENECIDAISSLFNVIP